MMNFDCLETIDNLNGISRCYYSIVINLFTIIIVNHYCLTFFYFVLMFHFPFKILRKVEQDNKKCHLQ